MRTPIATALAILFGLIVLVGYIFPGGTLDLRAQLINGAVTLAAFASLVAVLGLLNTHWRKLRARRNPDRYSLLVLGGFLLTALYGAYAYTVGSGSNADFHNLAVNGIQVPIEASLMAVVAVILTLAGFRLFQRRMGILPVVFIISALIFLLFNSGLLASVNSALVGQLLGAIQVLPIAGARGILIGIALGSLLAGLRVLFGADRPYSG